MKVLANTITDLFKKKRLWVLVALLFAGLVGYIIYTKFRFYNGIVHVACIQDYLGMVFSVAMPSIVLITLQEKKYNRTMLAKARDTGIGRTGYLHCVWGAGVSVLLLGYLIYGVVALLLALIFGAKLTGLEVQAILVRVLCDAIAAVGNYSFMFLLQTLFGICVIPIILLVLSNIVLYTFRDLTGNMITDITYKGYTYIPNGKALLAYTRMMHGEPVSKGLVLLVLIYIVVSLLFSVIIFSIRKEKKQGKEHEKEHEKENEVNLDKLHPQGYDK